MVPRNGSIRNVIAICVVVCLATSDARAQFIVPNSVSVNLNGGSVTLPFPGIALGNMFLGQQACFNGMGSPNAGQGAFLMGVDAPEGLHQETVPGALQKRELQWESRREWRKRCEADRQALSARRTAYNIQTDLRHFRDQPEPQRVASGASLNFLLKKLGPHLADVDFDKVHLTAEELASIRLQTAEGIRSQELNFCFDGKGRILWPEELRLVELVQQRNAVEAALTKLRQLERQKSPVDTQAKRVQLEITKLRSLAGSILRVKKSDEIGANASRDFLKHLGSQVAQLRSSEKRDRMHVALQPDVQSANELMQHVARHNLRFAPSESPTATAYLALHECLAEAHRDSHRPASSLHAAN